MLNYIAFINTLLKNLEESNLCCAIYNVKTSLLGYAGDVASAFTSKIKLDMVMNIVNEKVTSGGTVSMQRNVRRRMRIVTMVGTGPSN